MTSAELTIKGDIQRLHLEPGDRIVVTLERDLGWDELETLRDRTRESFPGHEVIVLEPGLSITVESEA